MQQKLLVPFSHTTHPTLQVTHSWDRQAFQSQTQTPESLCLRAFCVHRARGLGEGQTGIARELMYP